MLNIMVGVIYYFIHKQAKQFILFRMSLLY